MATLGDVIAGLRASVDNLPFTELADALAAVEEARDIIEQVSAGSGQTEFHQVIEWFSKVVSGIDELQRRLTAIHTGVTSAANRLEGSGRTDEVLTPVQPRYEKLLDKLPERAGGKTSGVWVDETGVERDIVSGEHDWQQARETLARLGIGPARGTLWVAAHVEVKLAAALREMPAQNVTLAVNNAPCDVGRWSCDRLLPRILRPGQSVTIHWPGGKQIYRGKEAQR